ncbi:MAG: glycyl-radical enzyme activating protein [candidate division Zixibacteria bacterium]|nr:glycyl-radical enzyme activating protein [candidate division Zixibacteria bacterium]
MCTTGIIFDLKKFAIHDGPGIRTTVFLKGCPLDCQWCHNPESRKSGPEKIQIKNRLIKEESIGEEITVEKLMKEIEKDKVFYKQSGGGVTFSGGEPMDQIGFLQEMLLLCQNNNISTAVDTSGFVPFEYFDKIYDLVDLFLYDLKIMENNLHQKYTGISNKLILDNLTKLAKMGDSVIIRIPIIPGVTDSRKNLNEIIDFVSPLKNITDICLLPYNKLGEDKRERFGITNKLGKLSTQETARMNELAAVFDLSRFQVKING